MVSLEEAFALVSAKFQIPALNEHQKVAIQKVVVRKKDVFVNLPTGFEKSLIYEALPLVFDYTTKLPWHIVIIVSPLASLMEDQVRYLRSIGVSAVNISSQTDNDHSKIGNGQHSVVFGSPEAWLMNDRWRTMLGTDVYKSKLCAVAIDEAHVIKQW
ncbi:putative ATP-dependent DNA helicase Q1 [Acropora palmata]|uniref:putative ATP-dependent DNA helicase Q1 n=1 Tax=Acropora palmata TaxID=6131 RepID=UPI003DA0B2ED